ncbi:hypothetical protein D1815_21300 [Aquimarina sp. AD1]|uniref:hypothetical protein n=1 Tax=Aquimarina sp. (strain AD1) TaxID=1714848 RepID=UPI000E507CFA|nr:hypothetical protein [Aquimarina sp. AD1]AXT58174.1 hypothetical protein D1815_21300 [Aquimarina sp. AD1]RKN24659.1 hypothetical protein D7035_11040 [Aquimarina sp. AD1]
MNETESKTEDHIFEQDYVRLTPTISKISGSRIQLLKYNFKWNNEKMIIKFNKILDPSEITQALNTIEHTGQKHC